MIKTVKKIIKISAIVFIIVTLIFYALFSLLYHTNLPQNIAKGIVEKELSNIFQREITIEKLTGNLLTQARFQNVVFESKVAYQAPVLIIKDLVAEYDLLRVIKNKGDFPAGTNLVKAQNIALNITREKDDTWEILSFLPPPPLDAPPPPPTFKGKILVDNLNITFIDKKGWAKEQIGTPFSDAFMNFTGIMDFKDVRKVSLDLKGFFASSQKDIVFTGFFDSYNGQYDINLDTFIDTNKWSRYVLPLKDFKIQGTTMKLNAKVKSKYPFPIKALPFYYNLNFTFDSTFFKMPFFKMSAQYLRGSFSLIDGLLHFNKFEGGLNDILMQGAGDLNFNTDKIALKIKVKKFDLEKLKGLFPATDKWIYKGMGTANLQIKERLSQPVVQGTLKVKAAEIYNLKPQNLSINYKLKKQRLNYGIEKADLYAGKLQGKGAVDFNYKTPQINGVFQMRNLALKKMFPGLQGKIKGAINLESKLVGNTGFYEVTSDLFSKDALIYNQHLNSLKIYFTVLKNKNIALKKADIKLNNDISSLNVSGNVTDLTDVHLFFEAYDLAFNDLDQEVTELSTANLAVGGEIRTQLNANFWQNPLKETTFFLGVTGTHFSFYQTVFDKLVAKVDFNKGKLQIQEFLLKSVDSQIKMSGIIDDTRPLNLKIKTENQDITNFKWIQKYIPNKYKPFGGKLFLDLAIVSKSASPIQPQMRNLKWLKDYQVTSKIQIKNGLFQNQEYQEFFLDSFLKKNILKIQKGSLKHYNSQVLFTGKVKGFRDFQFSFLPSSYIELDEFKELLSSKGDFAGLVFFDGELGGTFQNIDFDLNLAVEMLKLNYLSFQAVSGRLINKKNILSLQSGVFKKDNDVYNLDGDLDISPFFSSAKFGIKDLDYKINASFEKANLTTFSQIMEDIYQEVQIRKKEEEVAFDTHMGVNRQKKSYFLENPYFNAKNTLIYQNGNYENFYRFYEDIAKEQAALAEPGSIELQNLFSGQFSGEFQTTSAPRKLSYIKTNLLFENAQLGFLKAEKIRFDINTAKKDMNIDLLIKNGNLGGRDFDELSGFAVYKQNGILDIKKMDIEANQRKNNKIVTGVFPLASFWDRSKADNKINLKINLEKNDLGVFSVFNPYIKNITNKGIVQLRLTGKVAAPILNSRIINLNEAKIYFTEDTVFKSPFSITSAAINIKNNVIQIPDTKLFWEGVDTQIKQNMNPKTNVLPIKGKIKILNPSFLLPQYQDLEMDIKVKNTSLDINLPTIYVGKADLKDWMINGIYRIPLSEAERVKTRSFLRTEQELGPKIKGEVHLKEGTIKFPTLGEKQDKPSFLLDLDVAVKDDILITGSFFGAGLLSGLVNYFDLEVENTVTPLKVTGSLNLMQIKNNLYFARGTAYLFNRTFELLSLDRQKVFYKDPNRAEANYLSFKVDKVADSIKKSLIPILNLKALSIIEPLEATVTANVAQKEPYKGVVVIFDGSIYNLKSLTFEEYDIDSPYKRELDPQFVRFYKLSLQEVGNSQDFAQFTELMNLLMPEFMDRSGLAEQETSSKILNEMAAQRINLLFRSSVLRPIEKGLAQNIGLYDLRIDYNLGKTLVRNVGSQGDNLLGLNLVKDLYQDILFLNVNTELDLVDQNESLINSMEIGLTYYILKDLALSFSEIGEYGATELEFKPKLSLRYSYEF